MRTLFVAKTEKTAQEFMGRTTVQCVGPDDYVDAVGLYGSVFSTPDRIFMCEELTLNERTWEWLTQCVGIDRAWEVRWVLQ